MANETIPNADWEASYNVARHCLETLADATRTRLEATFGVTQVTKELIRCKATIEQAQLVAKCDPLSALSVMVKSVRRCGGSDPLKDIWLCLGALELQRDLDASEGN